MSLQKYLERKAVIYNLSDKIKEKQHAVVIPARDELYYLPDTLNSLACCENAEQVAVIIVVNNRLAEYETGSQVFSNNSQLILWLDENRDNYPFQLVYIDATSGENALADKFGVGMARKIGCDAAINYWAESGSENQLETNLIFHLDADSLVAKDYLSTGFNLLNTRYAGGIFPFKHRVDEPEQKKAIEEYELYLRYVAASLKFSGSIYGFYTIGSTMLSRADAYIKSGGMPAAKQAGEDFYFLQEINKVGGILTLDSGKVYPSSRLSQRVPFGTGATMLEYVENVDERLVYDFQVFVELKMLLNNVNMHWNGDLQNVFAGLTEVTVEFLQRKKIEAVWTRFQKQFKKQEKFIDAFNRWFDALATIRLIRELTRMLYPEVSLSSALQMAVENGVTGLDE